MDGLSNYYNTLLGIEVTVFGILAATVFVFIQLLYSRFSYREVRAVLATWSLGAIFATGGCIILATAVASLLISLGDYDFIASFNLRTIDLIRSDYFALVVSVAFLLAIAAFCGWAVTSLKYLHATKVLFLFSGKIKNGDIRDFLYARYGIPSPEQQHPSVRIINYSVAIKEIEEELKNKILGNETEPKPKSEERIRLEQELEEEEKVRAINIREHLEMQRAIDGSRDPFESMNQISLQALGTTDIGTFKEYNRELIRIATIFLSYAKSEGSSKQWNPEANLAKDFITHYTENMHAQLEVADKQGLASVRLLVLDTSKAIAESLIMNRQYKALDALADSWKRIADKYIISDPNVYKRVIIHLRFVVENLFKTNEEKNESMNEMFRVLGWLGEKLLIAKAIEKKPLMPDYNYSSEFDELMEAVLSIGSKYDYEYPTWYPLIFFDLVDVIFQKIITMSKDEYPRLHETIFNLVFIYSTFGEKAILVGNSAGAELAAMRLHSAVERLRDRHMKERQQEAVELLLSLAAFAAGHRDTYGGAGLTSPSLDEWAIDKIAELTTADEITHEVLEIYIKGEGDRDAILAFIKKLANRMRSEFGLNLS